jgi:hypothetical protein
MKLVTATFLVDEEKLLNAYKDRYDDENNIDNFHDALNTEFGWVEESGIYLQDWKIEKGE